MAEKQATQLELTEARYEELCNQLTKYRHEYTDIQTQFAPESEYLIEQLKKLETLLSIIKSETLVVYKELEQLREENKDNKKSKRKWGLFSKAS